MKLYFDSKGIDTTLIKRGIREPKATKQATRDYKKIRNTYDGRITVFDIGANIGYYALLAGRIFADRATIHAFEPEPENADRLRENSQLNGYNISIHNKAIGGTVDDVQLSIHPSSNRHKMANLEGDSSKKTVTVPQTTVDKCVKDTDSHDGLLILRVDVEGYEMHVLEGMKEIIESDRDCYLFIEMHSNLDVGDVTSIRNTLLNNGFKITFIEYGDKDYWPVGGGYHVAAQRFNQDADTKK